MQIGYGEKMLFYKNIALLSNFFTLSSELGIKSKKKYIQNEIFQKILLNIFLYLCIMQ